MATPEGKVKVAVVKLLHRYNAYYFFPATHGYGRSGVPDIVCCVKGKFVAIECKAGKNKPTELQEREIAAIKEAGGIALVINETNLHELKEVLEQFTGVSDSAENKSGNAGADT